MEERPSPIVVMSLRTCHTITQRGIELNRMALTMTLHDTEELDDDLRRGANEHLALAATLSVDNVVL